MNNHPIKQRIFNTPFDLGLRSLFILKEIKKAVDLQTLVYLDYFLVHSGDVDGGPVSIHPNAPFRAGEILIKRTLTKGGLQTMHNKQLLNVVLREDGIYYEKNKLTGAFLSHCSSPYSTELQRRAKWVQKKFGRYDEEKMRKYVEMNMQKWNIEFIGNMNHE